MFLLLSIPKVPEISLAILTAIPAGFELRTEKSPPNAPIEPAIELYFEVLFKDELEYTSAVFLRVEISWAFAKYAAEMLRIIKDFLIILSVYTIKYYLLKPPDEDLVDPEFEFELEEPLLYPPLFPDLKPPPS